MRIVSLANLARVPVSDFGSNAVRSAAVAHGAGESHCYVLDVAPGGVIGPHEAGFGQLLTPLEGDGWVAGPDGTRQPLPHGAVAIIERGELHSKGSVSGMLALMIQLYELDTSLIAT